MTQLRLHVAGPNAEGALNDAEYKAGVTVIPPVIPRIGTLAPHQRRWGVILAGGDGVRLRPLTQLICGDERPKQFCPLFRRMTLLEQTLQRSELSIPLRLSRKVRQRVKTLVTV